MRARRAIARGRSWLFVLTASTALPALGGQGPGYPVVTTYATSELAPDAPAYCAAQAPDGTLLVGSNGLLTFDGERWTKHGIDGAYGVRRLDLDSEGKLWATAVGDLGWFDRGSDNRWRFHSLRASLPPLTPPLGPVWYVFAQPGATIFVSENRIFRWAGGRFEMWYMPDTRRLPSMRVNGKVYVHYVKHGVYAINERGPEIFIPQSALGDAAVLWMEAQPGGWLLATSQGLRLYRNGRAEPFAPGVSELLRTGLVTSGQRLPDGRYAFGTYKGGLVLMRADGSLDRVLQEAEGLPTRSISTLCLDHGGALWAISTSQIMRIDVCSPSVLFDQRAELPSQPYRSIVRAGERLLLGTESGVFESGDKSNRFTHWPGLREQVLDLRVNGPGVLVAAQHGVHSVAGTQATRIHRSETDVVAVSPSRRVPGRFYFSDGSKILAWTPDAGARELVKDLPDYARSFAEDDAGHLWVGTIAKGVVVAPLDGDVPVQSSAPDPAAQLPDLRGRAVVRAGSDGTILVMADNGGWLKPARTQAFQPIAGYPARGIAAASEVAADGTLWLVHPAAEGLLPCAARVKIAEGSARWDPHAIPGLNEIGAVRSIAVETSPGGGTVLWLGGSQSVLQHELARSPLAPAPKPPLLTALARTGGSEALQVLRAEAEVPYSTRAIAFELAAPEFARRGQLRLETRIVGIDSDWMPAGPDSRRHLTALRDGRYTFHARAVAETGVASPTTTLTFRVLPPWWRTAPGLFLEVFALFPVGYGLYRLRVRTLKRRNAELEKKVRERTEELEAANAAKTQFVANMSHDIRNPLNGIVGLALALEDSKLDRGQREIVATLRECTTYLSSLVDDVLDFASIEAGRVELRPGPFAPHELLRSIVTTLKADTADRGAMITIEADPEVPPLIVGDPGRIQQIVVNFVSNALKYAGGHIRVAVSIPAQSPGEVEFSVADDGPGMSPEEQATLFTKFNRLARARREDIPGAGLGLAACRHLADLMGGSVGVESRVGHGARFYVRLPLSVAEKPAIAAAGALPNAAVLLVEDTDYNAMAAKAVLAKLGLSCERASTGEEAIRLFQQKRFNVVLLDRNLPDMDGTEVARRMRQLETDGVQAVLLAVTAYCTAEDRALCLEAGMDAFVGKPLTPEKLRKVLIEAGRRLLAAATLEVPAEPAPELDLQLLNYLADGSPNRLDAEIDRFLSVLRETESAIAASAESADWPGVAKHAHRVLGQARMVGSIGLAGAAERLEKAARAENLITCRDAIPALAREIQILTAAMRRHRRNAQSG